eukprot:gene2125-1301_t
MEPLRLEGNKLFASDPRRRGGVVRQGNELGAPPPGSLDEYSKCAGNALTALFQAELFHRCEAMARRALRVNPILAKANAFLGKLYLLPPSSPPLLMGPGETPLVFLCRAVFQLPALRATLQASLTAAVVALHRAKRASRSEEVDPEVSVSKGANGNGVYARSRVPAGVPLVSLDRPFSLGPYEEGGGEDNTSWNVCGTCKMAAWCSSSCREAHKVPHGVECSRLQKLQDMLRNVETRRIDVPDNFYELAYHAITTIAAYRTQRPGFEVLLRLDHHSVEVAQYIHPTVDLVYELWEGKEDKPFLAQILGAMKCNVMELTDPATGQGVAQALYCTGIASFFNHSCLPNCCIDTTRNLLCTIRDIEPGEELCIAYIPQLYWPTNLRQEALQESYFFTCRCQRCDPAHHHPHSGGPKRPGAASHRQEVDPFEKSLGMELPEKAGAGPTGRTNATREYHSRVQSTCHRIRSMELAALEEKMIGEVEALLEEVSQHLFPFHYLCHELRNTLSFLYAVFHRYSQCFHSCMAELLLWEAVLPGCWPVKAMKLSNALQCLEELDASERKAAMSKAVLGPYVYDLAKLYDVIEDDD